MNNTYYEEKIKTLPENLQYAVMISEWQQSLIEIQKKFKLHIDQTQVLEDVTLKLIFGDIDAPDFIARMFNDAHINSEMAADILLEVDLKILKRIRETLAAADAADKENDEIDTLLIDDEEMQAREDANEYADYYEDAERIRKEVEAESLKEGILPDGSNITDEMLGIMSEIPTNVHQEKEDLMKEIEAPTKSINLATTQSQPTIQRDPIPVDHQLENTHLENPYHEEDIVKDIPKSVVEPEKIPDPEPVAHKISTSIEPSVPKPTAEVKKPININLTDIYREPIE